MKRRRIKKKQQLSFMSLRKRKVVNASDRLLLFLQRMFKKVSKIQTAYAREWEVGELTCLKCVYQTDRAC